MPNETARHPAPIKIVYFDEQSASDYLDISAGGKATSTSEDVRKRSRESQAKVDAKLVAKLSWLPFLGGSAEVASGIAASSTGQSILSKTLSNTILTDYLEAVAKDARVERLVGPQLSAAQNSMAFIKMFTPFMIIAKTEDMGVDLARLDEALEGAKGYYELLAEDADGTRSILRFNIRAFRNNYGLSDLLRMRLTFHGIRVGTASEADLSTEAALSTGPDSPSVTALEVVDGTVAEAVAGPTLDVFDVLFAGVEHVE